MIVFRDLSKSFVAACINVERFPNLGGTVICHEALVSGELDLCVESSGIALTAVVNLETPDSPEVDSGGSDRTGRL